MILYLFKGKIPQKKKTPKNKKNEYHSKGNGCLSRGRIRERASGPAGRKTAQGRSPVRDQALTERGRGTEMDGRSDYFEPAQFILSRTRLVRRFLYEMARADQPLGSRTDYLFRDGGGGADACGASLSG